MGNKMNDNYSNNFHSKLLNARSTTTNKSTEIQSINLSNTNDVNYSKNYTNTFNNKLEHSTNNNQKYRISRINIDSRYRNIESKNIIDSNINYLEIDPLIFTKNSNIVKIKHNNHGLKINDKIILQGINYTLVSLQNGMTLTKNSDYIRINHKNHGLDLTSTTFKIKLENIIGNINNGRLLFNLPINELNQIHTIYFTKDSREIPTNNYYYIKLNTNSNTDYQYNLSPIKIFFIQLNGININQLNANYPTNNMQINGYQIIYDIIDDNTYTIQTTDYASTSGTNGGRNIWISKILDFIEGYPSNNYYKISLKKTFYNVTRIRIISTEFPNTEQVIKKYPTYKQNNLLYWQIMNDGNDIYSIEITPGNYTSNSLITEITNKMSLIERQNMVLTNNNIINENYSYNTKIIPVVNIYPGNDVFSLKLYQQITIAIPLSLSNNQYSDGFNRLRISHPNHNLVVTDQITISGAAGTNNIPAQFINTSFTIERILDDNTYEVKISKYNPNNLDNNVTNGGNVVTITYPIRFRLLFDRPHTIGNILGFRNINQPDSITVYDTEITNNSYYIYEYNININQRLNNTINLSGYNYILMCSPIFKEATYTSGNIDNVFAKLLLASDPSSIMYNQYIQLGEYFSTPISSLSELEVNFFDPMGEPFNFFNMEHSYTLEIYEDLTQREK